MKKFSAIFKILTLTLVLGIFTGSVYLDCVIPDKFYIEKGDERFSINCKFNLNGNITKSNNSSQSAELKLMGWFPIKTVDIENVERRYLVPSGIPFGIKMLTEGVIVTDFGDVKDVNNVIHSSPGEISGLLKGDVITEINGKEISSAAELSEITQSSLTDCITVKYQRENKESTTKITAIKDKSGSYKLGLWVRDSAAGIGTMTFFDPSINIFGGLGHGVCDVDSGKLLPLQSGEIVPATINNVIKGRSGAPGELCGTLIHEKRTGKIYSNTENGLFGYFTALSTEEKVLPIALKQEIKCGDAYILSTINGDKPERYSIRINSISLNSNNNKNMIIEITDKKLLDKTGGIVQGMSGSPIIQNNMLVGAITHVFVNDPTKGYGIFIENMLDFSE